MRTADPERERRALRTGLITASIAAAFLIGFFLKMYVFR